LHQGQVMAVNSPEETELLICGLVVKREGYLQVNNRIYQMVFDRPWVLKHLNDSEVTTEVGE
ncbi:MAG: hypothetical protein F6K45_13645, partial [Kamptonema sp. SIO1D9]|nr:hypothetical protein [Kamptonema sp. SIO1D9]